jgi:hypothetical protein
LDCRRETHADAATRRLVRRSRLPDRSLRRLPIPDLCDNVRAGIARDGRPSSLVYAGDFDPSGEDIARDFVERVGAFDAVDPVAVKAEQVVSLGLAPMPGKASDARAAAFVARHGQLMQVEVEAVHPGTLRQLYQDAIDSVWDVSAFNDVKQRELGERRRLRDLVALVEGDNK